MTKVKIIHKHSLAIRWLHWINFPLLGIMIWSGFLIYWANDVYAIKWGDTVIFKFFPEGFYKAINGQYRLADGMSWHFTFMWFYTLNGLLYILYLIVSKDRKDILPQWQSWREAWQVLLFDLRLRKQKPLQGKYNAAQRLAYTSIIVLGILSVVTGIAIFKPVQAEWLCTMLGGYEATRLEHFIITILFCLFFVIHIIQVILAGWKNFKSMVTGFETLSSKKHEK
jgi:thiosulfate reductase cytochrome b subunit